MNDSYYWQKHQAQERIENYRRQAEVHRQMKDTGLIVKGKNLAVGKISFAIAIGVSLVAVAFLMSS